MSFVKDWLHGDFLLLADLNGKTNVGFLCRKPSCQCCEISPRSTHLELLFFKIPKNNFF